MNEYKVTSADEDIRVDKLLTQLHSDFTRSEMREWFAQSLVQVNEVPVKANYRCFTGDIINWSPPEKEAKEIKAENIPLHIVYEDSDILVVNKEKGMVVHPSPGHTSGTLVNALLHYGTGLSQLNGKERPGIVHRLDKDTSGLLVVAKNDDAHQDLTTQLQDHVMLRHYEALVHGSISHSNGKIDAPIGRDPNNRQQMAVTDDGKQAITHFHVLKTFSDFSYVTCRLETGRTHQIRVHMKYIGHPLVGDPKYGYRKTLNVDGQTLHARKIGFHHPVKKNWLEFETALPHYFQATMEKIKKMY